MMGFTDTQKRHLKANLEPQHVKSRDKAGRSLSYIEGWHAIAEANRIFGFDAWDRETALNKLGEPQETGDKYRVRFMAVVTIRVRADGETVIRQGTGYGSGIAKDLGDAYEGAIKEAETDAMKRALMTFGNPFGLALYDKDQNNVGMNYRSKKESRKDYEDMQAEIDASDSLDALNIVVHSEDWKEKVATLPPDWQAELRKRYFEKREEFEAPRMEAAE